MALWYFIGARPRHKVAGVLRGDRGQAIVGTIAQFLPGLVNGIFPLTQRALGDELYF